MYVPLLFCPSFVHQHSEISTDKYWRYSFKSVMTSRHFTRYIVLNVEPILTAARPSAKIGKVRAAKGSSMVRGRGEWWRLMPEFSFKSLLLFLYTDPFYFTDRSNLLPTTFHQVLLWTVRSWAAVSWAA